MDVMGRMILMCMVSTLVCAVLCFIMVAVGALTPNDYNTVLMQSCVVSYIVNMAIILLSR